MITMQEIDYMYARVVHGDDGFSQDDMDLLCAAARRGVEAEAAQPQDNIAAIEMLKEWQQEPLEPGHEAFPISDGWKPSASGYLIEEVSSGGYSVGGAGGSGAISDERLRKLFLETNTAEPLAEGWPGLERFARAVLAAAQEGK